MQIAIELDEVKLQSVNSKYVYNPYAKRFVSSPEYRKLRKFLSNACKEGINEGEKIDPPYAVFITMETYLDIDNPLKCIIDSLEKLIVNDRYVLELHVKKIPIKRGKTGKLVVKVAHLDA